MPVAIEDGILGLEARHVWGTFTMNDLEAGLPRVKLTRIVGIHSLPEADDEREPRTALPGEWIYPSYPRGKTLTYEGLLEASNQQQLSALRHSMLYAFSERSYEGLMQVVPHPTYGAITWGYAARVLACDIDDKILYDQLNTNPTPYAREVVLSLRLSDPRYILMDGGSAEDIAANSGGQLVTPGGTAPADPVFEITTDLDVPIAIRNLSVNTSNGTADLIFQNWALPVGTTKVEINFTDHSVKGYTSPTAWADLSEYVNGGLTDWWDELIPGLVPGANLIASTHDTHLTYATRSW